MSPRRRLSAILHADLSGFVRLMEGGEDRTVGHLKPSRPTSGGPLSRARAVERGWAIAREDRKGKSKVRSASLTDDGRRIALKSLR